MASPGSARSTEAGVAAEAVREEKSDDSRERPLQDPQVGRGLAGERSQRVGGQRLGLFPSEVSEEDEAGGEVGRLDRHGQAPLEPVAEPLGQRGELGGKVIGGDHELSAALVEGVEGVEELLGGSRLALEELDVVDQ